MSAMKKFFASSPLADKGELPKEIKLLPKGEFNTVKYGPMQLDDEVFDQMVANFNRDNVLGDIPIDVNHDGGRAAGWINAIENREDGLWASEIDWTPYGEHLISTREYRMVSSEWSFQLPDYENSDINHGAVLIASTITNRPLFKSLPSLTASLTEEDGSGIMLFSTEDDSTNLEKDTMNVDDILAKKATNRSEEEVAFLAEADLTEDQEAVLEAEKEEVTIKASELEELKKVKAEREAEAKLQAATDFAGKFLASKEGGKVLPKAKDDLVEFVSSLTDEQKEQFEKIMEATAEHEIEGENGTDKRQESNVETFTTAVKDTMKENKISYREATKIVMDEKPELYEAYEAELSGKK